MMTVVAETCSRWIFYINQTSVLNENLDENIYSFWLALCFCDLNWMSNTFLSGCNYLSIPQNMQSASCYKISTCIRHWTLLGQSIRKVRILVWHTLTPLYLDTFLWQIKYDVTKLSSGGCLSCSNILTQNIVAWSYDGRVRCKLVFRISCKYSIRWLSVRNREFCFSSPQLPSVRINGILLCLLNRDFDD
jgi:hypothetical protein